jgi:adenine-specific DNA-methyltransferase
LAELREMCAVHGDVVSLAFDSKRYVGAQIGIHNPRGERVGEISHTRNLEYVLVAGPAERVAHITAPFVDQRI